MFPRAKHGLLLWILGAAAVIAVAIFAALLVLPVGERVALSDEVQMAQARQRLLAAEARLDLEVLIAEVTLASDAQELLRRFDSVVAKLELAYAQEPEGDWPETHDALVELRPLLREDPEEAAARLDALAPRLGGQRLERLARATEASEREPAPAGVEP